MPRSWCARCDRRRVFPPECQRRHQLGASGDRASPPNRSRSPRHRPGHAPRRAAADRVHDGVRVHRVPSRMFPKVTSLPLGVPRPRMVGVLRGFDPDVVHLASPALLGYGGLHAARYLGVPTVAVFQTDVAGFAQSYGIGIAARAAWAWTRHLHSRADRTLAPSTSAMENLAAHRIPRIYQWARGVDITGFAPSARDDGCAAVVAGREADRRLRRPARPEKHVERLAVLARRDDLQLVIVGDGVDRAKLEIRPAVSGFHRRALRRRSWPPPYASMDVFVHPGEHETFCQAVQEAMASGPAGHRPRRRWPADLVAPCTPACSCRSPSSKPADERGRPPARRASALLGGRPPQRAGPHLAGDLRRADRPLRGGARHPRRQGRPEPQAPSVRWMSGFIALS